MTDVFLQEKQIIIAAADKLVALGQEAAQRILIGKEAVKQDTKAKIILNYLTAYRRKDVLDTKQLEGVLYALSGLSI